MGTFGVVVADPAAELGPQLQAGPQGMQAGARVSRISAAPEPLDEHVIPAAAMVFDTRQDSIARVAQSTTATKYGKPCARVCRSDRPTRLGLADR